MRTCSCRFRTSAALSSAASCVLISCRESQGLLTLVHAGQTSSSDQITLCDVATGWFDSRAFYRPVPVLGANEGASFSRAIEITAAVLSVRGVAAHNMALVIYHMPFLSTGIMPGGSNALVAALYRQ